MYTYKQGRFAFGKLQTRIENPQNVRLIFIRFGCYVKYGPPYKHLKTKVKRMATEGSSTSSKMVVAAIDFGTTYSGYAYSFKGTWPKAITNRWESGNSTSFKTPTILLLNPDQTFHSFGYDAEMNYADIAEEGDEEGRTCKEYYLFKHFKMFLKDCLSKVCRSTEAHLGPIKK